MMTRGRMHEAALWLQERSRGYTDRSVDDDPPTQMKHVARVSEVPEPYSVTLLCLQRYSACCVVIQEDDGTCAARRSAWYSLHRSIQQGQCIIHSYRLGNILLYKRRRHRTITISNSILTRPLDRLFDPQSLQVLQRASSRA